MNSHSEAIPVLTGEDVSDAITHYGVLGMKWGVRNSDTRARYAREKSAKKTRKTEARNIRAKRKQSEKTRKAMREVNEERVKTIKQERLEANRNRALMSDAELRQRIQRLQLERQLNQLTQQELTPARYAVKSALVSVGTESLKNESKGAIKSAKKKIKK